MKSTYRVKLFLSKDEIVGRSDLRDKGLVGDIEIAIVSCKVPIIDHSTPGCPRLPPIVWCKWPFSYDTTSLVSVVELLQAIYNS